MTAPNQFQNPPQQPTPTLQPPQKKKMNGCVLAAIIVGAIFVVMTVLAIVASIAVPVYNNVVGKAKAAKALSNSKQLATACKIYAGDNGGLYPTAGTTSNESFALLMPEYVTTERIFAAEHSNWGPSNDDREPYLEAGENHWDYMSGLYDSTQNLLPFIFDGSTGQPGVYTDNKYRRGGRGQGHRAIVAWTDLSVENIRLTENANGDFVLPIDFSQLAYPKEAKYQNPAR